MGRGSGGGVAVGCTPEFGSADFQSMLLSLTRMQTFENKGSDFGVDFGALQTLVSKTLIK